MTANQTIVKQTFGFWKIKQKCCFCLQATRIQSRAMLNAVSRMSHGSVEYLQAYHQPKRADCSTGWMALEKI